MSTPCSMGDGTDDGEQEPLQVVSASSTINGYIILAFANSLQSRAPQLTTEAVQGLATKLGSETGNKGVTLFGNREDAVLKH